MCGRSNESNKLNLFKIYNFVNIDDRYDSTKKQKYIYVYRDSCVKKKKEFRYIAFLACFDNNDSYANFPKYQIG